MAEPLRHAADPIGHGRMVVARATGVALLRARTLES